MGPLLCPKERKRTRAGRTTKEKLEEPAAAELPYALKRRNPPSAEMKSSQIVAAGACRSPTLRKRQSSCSLLPKLGLFFPFHGLPSPCRRACMDVCRQTSLSGRRQCLRFANRCAPFASMPRPAKRPNDLRRSRRSPGKLMGGRSPVVIGLRF